MDKRVKKVLEMQKNGLSRQEIYKKLQFDKINKMTKYMKKHGYMWDGKKYLCINKYEFNKSDINKEVVEMNSSKEAKINNWFMKIMSNTKENDTNISKKIIAPTMLFTIIGVMLYGVGYLFFYGYYFVRNENVMLLEIIINPVPFKFHTVVIISIILLFVLTSIILPCKEIYQSINGKKIHKLFARLLLLTTILLVDYLILTFIFFSNDVMACFMGKSSIDVYGNVLTFSKFFIILIAIIFFCILLLAKKFQKIFYGFILSLIITILITLIYEHVSTEKFVLGEYFTFVLWNIIATILCFIKDGLFKSGIDVIAKSTILFFILLFCQPYTKFILSIPTHETIKIIILFIVPLLITLLIILLNTCRLKIKNIEQKESEKKLVNNLIEKIEYFINDKSKIFAILSILCGIYILIIGNYTLSLGTYVGSKFSSLKNEHIIAYSNGKSEPIYNDYGIIVANTENIYYISDENRKLVTIKSDNIISMPINKNAERKNDSNFKHD